jgi:hypothetical protein
METQESHEKSLTGDQHGKTEVAKEHHAAVDSSDVSDGKKADDQTQNEEPNLTEMKASSDESHEATNEVFMFLMEGAYAPASSVLLRLAVRNDLQMNEKGPLTNGSDFVFAKLHVHRNRRLRNVTSFFFLFFFFGGGGILLTQNVQNDRHSAII